MVVEMVYGDLDRGEGWENGKAAATEVYLFACAPMLCIQIAELRWRLRRRPKALQSRHLCHQLWEAALLQPCRHFFYKMFHLC